MTEDEISCVSPKVFHTTYAMDGGRFGGEIEADDIDHARLLAVQRGLNERVDGSMSDSKLCCAGIEVILGGEDLRPTDLAAALHEAVFLCFVGLSSGALSVRECLGDVGLLHELAHLLAGDTHDIDRRIENLRRMAKDFAGRVPGWPRPTGTEAP